MHGAALGAERYLDLMGHDKKVIAGKLRLVLLKAHRRGGDHAPMRRASRYPRRHRGLLPD